jgi:hypothetical protein
MMRYPVLALGTVLLCSVSAQAGLLSPDQFDAKRLLPPPPAMDSAQTRDELQELHTIAGRTSPQELAAATHDAKDETADIFNAAIGLDLKTMPETFKLLTMVGDEEEDDTKDAKRFFHRNRPYAEDGTLKTCTMVMPGKSENSYPSGHATRGFAMGEVLAALMPAKAQAILARSAEYAEHRLVCGVHYRSDTVAGRQYGTIIALRLMENPVFQAQMAKASAELSAAHLAP